MENSKKDSGSKFSFAMNSLKGILDQEGIVKTSNKDNPDTFIPTLSVTEYITTDVTDLPATSTKDDIPVIKDLPVIEENAVHPPVLEGTITVIDEADTASIALDAYISDLQDVEFDLVDFSNTHADDAAFKTAQKPARKIVSKEEILQQLTAYIDQSVEQFKTQLTSSLNEELEHLFNKSGN